MRSLQPQFMSLFRVSDPLLLPQSYPYGAQSIQSAGIFIHEQHTGVHFQGFHDTCRL
jgi:hypothetical protein